MLERVEADRTSLVMTAMAGALIALLVILQTASQASLAVVAVGVALLAILERRAALTLILPAIALSPEIPALGVPIRLEDLLMIPLVAGWLAKLCVSKERQGTVLDRVLIAYFLVGLAATLWGGYLGTAHLATADKYTSAPFHLLKRLEFVFLFFIMTDTLGTPADVKRFTYLLMASMVGLNAFGLSQFLSNKFLALAPTGAPVHEPGLAAMLNIALALSLRPAARGAGKLLVNAVIIFSVAVLPLALGRTLIVVSALVALYVGVFQQRWILALFPAIWFAGGHIYPQHVIDRVMTLRHVFEPDITGAQTQGASLISRIVAPGFYSILALGSSPILGFGLATVALGSIDNEYVAQLFYTGLVGLGVFLLFGGRLFRLAGEARAAAQNPLHASLARAFQVALVAYAVFSLLSPSISAARGGGLFFVLISLLAILHRSIAQPSREVMRPRRA